ncbi:MAG: hypothetical protein AB7E79_15090 [Rhodospirillaceae bacterium]
MRTFAFSALALLCSSALAVPAWSADAPQLPDGKGKDVVEAVCTGCHPVNMILTSSGYSRAHWEELTGTMIALDDAASREAILTYLSTNFPPNTKRASKAVAGAHKISFQQWTVPTLGQRSRDPVEAPDGTIWWVGQFGNVMGRLDPKTGEMKEFPLPENAKPHSVTIDADGNPWYTGNANGTIGKLDAKTGEVVKVYRMPDPKARDPHTAEFDKNGILWFTLQQANMFGRLDPKSGDIKLVTAKTANARPYGVKIDADGNPWYACNGAPCLVKVDARTMEQTEIKLPTPGTTVRRLDIAANGDIWFVNSSKGKIGRLTPKTGEIKEWDSPSGASAHPYALAVVDGVVWYNESGVRPDMLVRFDPRSETFQSWPIASGGVHAGIVRHMRPARNGDLLIHQSSTNRIMRVPTKGITPSS